MLVTEPPVKLDAGRSGDRSVIQRDEDEVVPFFRTDSLRPSLPPPPLHRPVDGADDKSRDKNENEQGTMMRTTRQTAFASHMLSRRGRPVPERPFRAQ